MMTTCPVMTKHIKTSRSIRSSYSAWYTPKERNFQNTFKLLANKLYLRLALKKETPSFLKNPIIFFMRNPFSFRIFACILFEFTLESLAFEALDKLTFCDEDNSTIDKFKFRKESVFDELTFCDDGNSTNDELNFCEEIKSSTDKQKKNRIILNKNMNFR